MKKIFGLFFLSIVILISIFIAHGLFPSDPGVAIWEKYNRCTGKIISTPYILLGGSITEMKIAGGIGTGFIVNKKSKKILSVAHMITKLKSTVIIEGLFGNYEAEVVKMKYIFIDFKGKEHNAKPIWIDKKHDISEMIIDISDKDIEDLEEALIDDSGSIRVAEDICVIGHAAGYNKCIVSGIVSSLEPTINSPFGILEKLDLIQMSAPVNPGQSGGPVIRMRDGKVVGIVKQVLVGAQGVSYATHVQYRPKDN